MNKSILDRAQRLYAEGRAIVESEVELKKKSTQYIVRLANILKELYQIFLDRKDPTERLVLVSRTQGFAEFRDAMLELLRPLDLGERSGWYYLSIGRHLLGKIPEEALKDLPLEKVKQLARVAKVKHEISPQLVERAKDHDEPSSIFREHIDVMLYRGAPDHSDGPKRSLPLVGGKNLIDAIEEKIGRLRPSVTDVGSSAPASDALVVDFALADCLAGIQTEGRDR